MRRRVALVFAFLLMIVLSGCGQSAPPAPPVSSSSAATSSAATAAPSTTASPVKAGVVPGIVVGHCARQQSTVTVSSYQAGGQENSSQTTFEWTADEKTNDSFGLCQRLTAWTNGYHNGGTKVRAGFNADYTRVLATHNEADGKNTTIGWLDTHINYTPLSPRQGSEFTKQQDAGAVYHAATDRVYYFDRTKEPSQLMSCAAAGGDVRTETELAQKYHYAVAGRSPMFMPKTTVPIVDQADENHVYNQAGTLGAVIADYKLVVDAPDKLINNPKSIKLTGSKFSGELRLGGFVDDNTLIMQDDKQIYAVVLSGGTATVTTLLHNDKLRIWDPTPGPDHKTVAFLAQNDLQAVLYTVPLDGSGADAPHKVADFDGTLTAIMEFSS